MIDDGLLLIMTQMTIYLLWL